MKRPSDLEEISRLIREGEGGQAGKWLLALPWKRIPRKDLASAAQLAWRSGLPILGLKILHPIVRPEHRLPRAASAEEKAEYAVCLIKAGATEEGLLLLRDPDTAALPRRLLYEAFGLIGRWDWGAAIPLLSAYVRRPGLEPYQRLVGKVNLANALLGERQYLKAEILLRELLHEASVKRLGFAQGKVLELAAQNFIFQKKWDQARKLLDRAEDLLRQTQSVDSFFTAKWKVILEFQKNPTGTSLRKLSEVREQARARGLWEIARDCDRFQAIQLKDGALLSHLYFGTPYESFRQRLALDASPGWKPGQEYVWKLENGGRPWLDLRSGRVEPAGKPLKAGQVLHRCLLALSTDFYRPFRIASLFSHLYPGEHFNPITSPARAHSVFRRLRFWLKSSRMPLAILEENGGYRIGALRPCALKVSLETSGGGRAVLVLRDLERHWGESPFNVQAAVEKLGIPYRTLFRLLRELVEGGSLERRGAGYRTSYRVVVNISNN